MEGPERGLRRGDLVLVSPGTVVRRPVTQEEFELMSSLEWCRGLDDAGEPRLAPRVISTRIERETPMVVERARARIPVSLGRPRRPGGVALVDPSTGHVVYARREDCRLLPG